MSGDEGYRRVGPDRFDYCSSRANEDRFEYLWQDSENYRRPTKMSAPAYIEHMMSWVQSNIDNEQMFPSRIGAVPAYRSNARHSANTSSRRCPLPEIILQFTPSDLQASVPSVCTHLLPPLPRGRSPGPRTPFEHQLQALRPLH